MGWSGAESNWKDEEIKQVNNALEQAAREHVTVLAPADDNASVSFPGSSPWVLSVGGTALKAEGGRIISEIAGRSNANATSGGVSVKFGRPDWQSAVLVPNRHDGQPGRGIPDVVASADFLAPLIVHGRPMTIGGISAAMPMWAGLIARINQALGYNVGYLNPRLYREIGPEGVFRNVTVGANGVSGVEGNSARSGWSPVAGWGSPDGTKLLNWLREHPNPPGDKNAPTVAVCRTNSK